MGSVHQDKERKPFACSFNIHNNEGQPTVEEQRRQVTRKGHEGTIYELSSPDGINFGYYNVHSQTEGKVVIDNQHPFLQLSYTVNGRKNYTINEGKQVLASFEQQQYNYLFFNDQSVHLNWPGNEHLEMFVLGLSPEFFSRFLPESHPLHPVFTNTVKENVATAMSKTNLPLMPKFSSILYDILNCPLENRYKQLYVKAKSIELLSFQLEQYEQFFHSPRPQTRELKKEDIDKMYHARDIILSNLNSPCSLINLAYQVGTNENYLKNHFKAVFGTTVFGYMTNVKMQQAKEMLLEGKTVSEVAYLTGYKNTPHFTRAFKKYFGYAPNKIKN